MRDGSELQCREVRQDGRVVGELEVSLFAAALVIDRDGILAETAVSGLNRLTTLHRAVVASPVALPGGNGFRTAAVNSGPLPYLYAFAIAPSDLGVDGGVLITIRAASPDWAPADHVLRSLRVLTRSGRVATNIDSDDAPILPVVGTPRED